MAPVLEKTPGEAVSPEPGVKVDLSRDNKLGLKGWLVESVGSQKSDAPDDVEGVASATSEPAKAETESEEQKSEAPMKAVPVATEEPKKTDKVKVDISVEESKKLLKERDRVITRLGQTNAELKAELAVVRQQIEVVNQKLDGTYDAKKTDTVSTLTLEQATMRGRIETSTKVAAKRFKDEGGLEYVQAKIFAPDAPFRKYDNNPAVLQRVFGADSPVEEALSVLDEEELRETYSGNLKDIIAQVRQETIESLKAGHVDGKPAAVPKPVPKRVVGVGPDVGGETDRTQTNVSNLPSEVDPNKVFPWLKNAPFGAQT